MSVVWTAVLTACRDGNRPESAVVDRALDELVARGLPEDAARKLRQIRNLSARTQSVAARLALVWARAGGMGVYAFDDALPNDEASAQALCGLTADEQGAPYLAGGTYAISLSHCEPMAIAVCTEEGRVGVDMEPIGRRVSCAEDMAKRYFSPAEYREWQAEGADHAYLLRIWTRKEALGKALGLGLAHIGELDTTGAENASFCEIPMEGFVITVCQVK